MAARLARAYRATGATPPFGDPVPPHPGIRMEGYYWRLTDARSGRVLIALCGVCDGPQGPWALVALAAHPGGFLREAIVPGPVEAGPGPSLRVGDALRASAGRLEFDLGPDARLHASVGPEPAAGRRARPAFGGLGPAGAIPHLGQYWHPYLLGRPASGHAEIGHESLDLDGARAYAEKNWGEAFPGRWWWGEAHDFAGADACVAFAGGELRRGPLRIAPTAIAVRIGAERLRFVAPTALVRARAREGKWVLRGRSAGGQLTIEGHAAAGDAHRLPVPIPRERRLEHHAAQHLAGAVRVELRRRGRVRFAGESSLAGLELGG